MSALGRQRQEDLCEFEASLVCKRKKQKTNKQTHISMCPVGFSGQTTQGSPNVTMYIHNTGLALEAMPVIPALWREKQRV